MLKQSNGADQAVAVTSATQAASPYTRRANLVFVCERIRQREAAQLLAKILPPRQYRLIWLNALVPHVAKHLQDAGISEDMPSHALRRKMKRFHELKILDESEALRISACALSEPYKENDSLSGLYARAYGLVGRVLQELATNSGIALLANQATDFPAGWHRIHLCAKDTAGPCCERSDWRVPLKPENDFVAQVAIAIANAEQSHCRRTNLRKLILDKKAKLAPKPTLERWPTDPLMKWAQAQIVAYLQDWKLPKHADKTDLKHQIAFRLTTIPLERVATDGAVLAKYLVSAGAFDSWSNIPRLSAEKIDRYRLRPEMLRHVTEEQTALIERRLQTTSAPVLEVKAQYRDLAEGTWYIRRVGGELRAVEQDGSFIPLEFKPVPLELAKAIHSTLHYIHSPRADWAFGLFAKGADLPFSVISAARIDREYKQNALLFQGYPVDNAVESTRLYTFDFAPRYTSSAILKLLTRAIRQISPSTPVMLSAFMASHATGLSMVSGGFRDPVLAKPLSHRFLERDGLYEHTVQRRMAGAPPALESCWPLLPAFELMCPLDPPHYTPMSGALDHMIDLT